MFLINILISITIKNYFVKGIDNIVTYTQKRNFMWQARYYDQYTIRKVVSNTLLPTLLS